MSDLDTDRIGQQLQAVVRFARQESLRIFVHQLMIALAKENYRLDDLLEALVHYSGRRADWSKVSEHLSAAVQEVRGAKKKITGK
jgi:hypothetical protein